MGATVASDTDSSRLGQRIKNIARQAPFQNLLAEVIDVIMRRTSETIGQTATVLTVTATGTVNVRHSSCSVACIALRPRGATTPALDRPSTPGVLMQQ